MSIRRAIILSAVGHMAGLAALAPMVGEPLRLNQKHKRKPRHKQAKPQIKVGRSKKSHLIKGVRP